MSAVMDFLSQIGLDAPYRRNDLRDIPLDLQGWGAEHPYFASLVSITKPSLIIEVGSWKGASAIGMANVAKSINSNVAVLCIDTWLGSPEIWLSTNLHPLLELDDKSEPTVYRQFLANVLHSKMTDTIFPLRMSSLCAATILQRSGVTAELIYIDAGHSEYEVYGDLIHFWPLVRPGGILFGDDYWTTWGGVIRAVNRFAHERELPLETSMGKWFFKKEVHE